MPEERFNPLIDADSIHKIKLEAIKVPLLSKK